MHDNINDMQIRKVKEIRLGKMSIPESHDELADLIVDVLLTLDHESLEFDKMTKCRKVFIKTYIGKINSYQDAEQCIGGVYLSSIKDVLSRRKYFKDLHKMTRLRCADGFKEVYQFFIKNGYARRDGEKIIFLTDPEVLLVNLFN